MICSDHSDGPVEPVSCRVSDMQFARYLEARSVLITAWVQCSDKILGSCCLRERGMARIQHSVACIYICLSFLVHVMISQIRNLC